MSVNFYDNSGVMNGTDPHQFYAVGPGGVPAPSSQPYGVAAPMFWPTATWYKRTGTVLSDGWQMIQGGFDLYIVPHVPPPIPPHPVAQPVEYVMIMATSSSKARMMVHGVTGEGKPLATCLLGPLGANTNCAKPLAVPFNVVLNLNSVKTSPTMGDYIGAAAGYAVDAVLGAFVGKFLGGLGVGPVTEVIVKLVFRRRSDLLKLVGLDKAASIADIATRIQRIVQEVFDGD